MIKVNLIFKFLNYFYYFKNNFNKFLKLSIGFCQRFYYETSIIILGKILAEAIFMKKFFPTWFFHFSKKKKKILEEFFLFRKEKLLPNGSKLLPNYFFFSEKKKSFHKFIFWFKIFSMKRVYASPNTYF